jgi:hypothetical protein
MIAARTGAIGMLVFALGSTPIARAQEHQRSVPEPRAVQRDAPADQASTGTHEDVANQLQNPIANLTSVPLQNNFESGIGPEDGFGYTLNIQPVIPVPLGSNLNLISRTILPLIDQPEFVEGTGRKFGLGDLTQSFFFAPVSKSALTWGVGPVFLLPIATDDRLGTDKWGIGPTVIALVQLHGWTAGALVNHIWSFAGDSDRGDIDTTFMQPFVSYTLPSGLSFTTQTETSYDWETDQWTVPLALGAAQVLKLGKLPVSVGVFGRYWVEGAVSSPDWSIRVPITFVLPALFG